MRALSAIGFLLFTQACFVSVDEFPVSTSEIGDACDDSKPCPPDLDCWRADADPGAPGGMCTKTCVTSDDCPSGSNCVDVGSSRTCLLACEYGASDSSKCRGRRELGCTQENSCRPLCSSDEQCPGRYCDLEAGLCADEPSTGKTPTELCLMEDVCRGTCANAGPAGFCEELCVLGKEEPSCTATGDIDLVCVDMRNQGAKIGDVGQCAPTCSCVGDTGCGDNDFKCVKIGVQHYCLRFGADDCLL